MLAFDSICNDDISALTGVLVLLNIGINYFIPVVNFVVYLVIVVVIRSKRSVGSDATAKAERNLLFQAVLVTASLEVSCPLTMSFFFQIVMILSIIQSYVEFTRYENLMMNIAENLLSLV